MSRNNDRAKRKLLLFQRPSPKCKIHQELTEENWDVHVADDLHSAFDLQEKHGFKVGLCLVDSHSHSTENCLLGKSCLIQNCHDGLNIDQLNRLFHSTASIEWIIGIPKECNPYHKSNDAVRKLIADHCYNYVTLPIDISRLLITLGHAYGMSELSQQVHEYVNGYPSRFGIIGDSPTMLNLYSWMEKVIKEDCSALIEGETGTGKDMVARAIHEHSSRSQAPFVAINCGAFPKDLIQAELFGYEKGAFTGAQQRKIGCIESAQGGTLFLDEIGDLPLSLQVNLLRFLEDRTITRIGGSSKIPVNLRVIAATHVDLRDAVNRGDFREDLYYRLKVLQFKTSSLRERGNDIELLAHYFFNYFTKNRSYKAKRFHQDSLFLLKSHSWPGNIRELKNCIQHALVMSENKQITPNDLGLDQQLKTQMLQTLEEARACADRELIINCLRLHNQNIKRAADALGISRVSLYRLVEKYNIELVGKDAKMKN